MTYRSSRIEVLENRIAPAVFFVSADTSGEGALKVFKGSDVAGGSEAELAALSLTGADAAVLLKKGDILVFDADGDRKISDGDTTMLKVTGGSAMVFLSDTEQGANAGGFDLNEITGLFVSNKFKGTVSVDVNGSIITALDASGKIEAEGSTVTIQNASIAQLTAEGQIVQSVLAGGSISNLTVGVPILGSPISNLSVSDIIATGSKTDLRVLSFDGGTKFLTTSFEQQAGKAGPNISNVKLANGAGGIFAGDGGLGAKGNAGKGGSVKNVTVEAGTSILSIDAGRGGDAEKGKAGAGGTISNITYTAAEGATDAGLNLYGGFGGNAVASGGGAGGSVSKVKFFQKSGDSVIRIAGGLAGFGVSGNGASGGSVSSITIEADRVFDLAISGGSSAVSSQGPAFRDELDFPATPVLALKKGGTGGSVSKVSFTGEMDGLFEIEGGMGGIGLAGGLGGSTSNIDISLTGFGSVRVEGGEGGSSLGGKSGNGGALSKVTLKTDGVFNDVYLNSGNAGSIVQGKSTKVKAGTGGKLSGIDVINDGTIAFLDVVSGEGGYVVLGAGTAGKSGSVSDVSIVNSSILTTARVHSGQGGTMVLLAVGDGGDSGDVSKIKIEDTSEQTNSYAVYAGFPSEEYSGPGKGDIFSGGGKLGSSMAGQGFGTKGGSVGDVSGVVLDAPRASIEVGVGGKAGAFLVLGSEVPPGGDSMPLFAVPGAAGDGGEITGVSGKVGTLRIAATGGGDGFAGTGGKGGSVRNINITEVTDFVHIIAAVDGGVGVKAGSGGSLDRITVKGDIGNFTQAFGFQAPDSSMGGLAAGKAGGANALAGSVTRINADRIAAIVAGQPETGELTYENAVSRISGITADVVGADLDGNGFTFTEGGANPGFQPDENGTGLDGDVAIDGLVLVLAGSKSVLPGSAVNVFQVPKVSMIL